MVEYQVRRILRYERKPPAKGCTGHLASLIATPTLPPRSDDDPVSTASRADATGGYRVSVDPEEDPFVAEVRRFVWTWAEHDPDCTAATLTGPSVMDPGNCECGLTIRTQEILATLASRLAQSN